MSKKWIALASVLVLVTAITVYSQWPDHYLHIIHCDVGQGDATLVSFYFTQMLIDGGKNEKVLTCLGRHMPLSDNTIEIIVATHPDADHIGGLASVFSVYKVKMLVTNADFKKTAEFTRFYEAVQREQQENLHIQVPNQLISYSLGPATQGWWWWDMHTSSDLSAKMSPFSETTLSDASMDSVATIGSYNERSIVTYLRYNVVSLLVMGDLEENGELALTNTDLLSDVTILKVGHHGSKTSTTEALLEKTAPEIALVSAGKNNTYGHPHREVIERLRARVRHVYRTDELGTVELVTDGQVVWRK